MIESIKIKLLHPEARIPEYAEPFAAGADLTAVWCSQKPNYMEFGFGFALEIPNGYAGLIFPRSSISNTGHRLCNAVGVIDPSYRGEVTARFDYKWPGTQYKPGMRIAQLLVVRSEKPSFKVAEELYDPGTRGTGGYGSTGNFSGASGGDKPSK